MLEAVCQEILEKAQAYLHAWKPTDMLAWDNWRMLHSGAGCNPRYDRLLHRTTVQGDYGLGYWEGKDTSSAAREVSQVWNMRRSRA